MYGGDVVSEDFYGNVIPKNVIIEIYNDWKEGRNNTTLREPKSPSQSWLKRNMRTSPCGNCTCKMGSWLQTRCEKYGHRSDWNYFRHLCPDCREIILESEKQGGD